jgi:riboflavin synthase
MFTGIVERSLPLISATDGTGFRRLTLPNPWPDVKLGDSIALNGVCLTVAEMTDGTLGFDAIPETLRLTNLGQLRAGDPVHVERALRAGDRMDGHFVQGHVDATASLIEQVTHHNEFRLKLETPPELGKYLIPKGSVTLDGVSLTIASLTATTFEVALIPTTLNVTALGLRPLGWAFNLECDILSKTIVSYLERLKGTAF